MAGTTPGSKKNTPPRNWVAWFFAVSFSLLALLAVYQIRIVAITSAISEKMELVNKMARFPEYGIPLRKTYTGVGQLDQGLAFLVSSFIHGTSGWDKGFYVLQVYFLVSYFAVVAVWTVESCRKRNSVALISFTSIWALFYQTVGGAIIVPLYYLAYLWDSADSQYWSAESRQVPVSYAKALLPALLLGYLVPTTLMFLPYSDSDLWTTQAMIALWQPSPWFVNAILWILSTFYGSMDSQTAGQESSLRDMKYLDSTYMVVFLVSVISHFGTVLVCLLSDDPQHSFSHAFVPHVRHVEPNLTEGLHAIFQYDFWIIFAASLLWIWLAVWDLKRVGKTNASLSRAALLILFGTIAVGPAATIVGVWYWREHVMAKANA
ncbi:hypothetical protein A1O3_01081 [Capronia epimyces CBS 606.96]|uniref:Uncharacterized protein n=1 Tax=Capronia epimyces CBS 606.96 TaxID=1182542 RepID=W9ZDD3_9EURO|nr:uncharacterized protein A1O3_01081 [Capronia epimyces CBS 606.96]EXJ92529.1 hypothetical protein A1O3_01081 [Capronia epimyces CBS 606.96]